jgi:hypothetical protein
MAACLNMVHRNVYFLNFLRVISVQSVSSCCSSIIIPSSPSFLAAVLCQFIVHTHASNPWCKYYNVLVMGPKGVPAPRRIGRLTVGHNINSTQLILSNANKTEASVFTLFFLGGEMVRDVMTHNHRFHLPHISRNLITTELFSKICENSSPRLHVASVYVALPV